MSIRDVASRLASIGIVERKLDDGELVAAEPRHEVGVAQAGAEPLRHGLEQFVADRMAERIVDALEVVEIEAVHGEALALASATRQQFVEPLIEQDAIGQIGQRVMMRHIGNARLGLFALGDIDQRHQDRRLVAERHPAAIDQHVDLAAIGLDVAPAPLRLEFVADGSRDLLADVPFVARPQIVERHVLQTRTAIAVMCERGVIDAEDLEIVRIVEPHRHRIAVEQQPERGFALLEIADIGERHRQKVADRSDAGMQMHLARRAVAVVTQEGAFELLGTAGADGGQETRRGSIARPRRAVAPKSGTDAGRVLRCRAIRWRPD